MRRRTDLVARFVRMEQTEALQWEIFQLRAPSWGACARNGWEEWEAEGEGELVQGRRLIMRRRTFVGLVMGVVGVPLLGRVSGRVVVIPVGAPIASPAVVPGGSPVASPGASHAEPVATAFRSYAATGRFAWERIGAALLRAEVARFETSAAASIAFPGLIERRVALEGEGAAAFSPVDVPAFADDSAAWAGFDGEGSPTAVLFVREGRDVHGWLARQITRAGRTPNPAHPLGALVRIAKAVFATPRPEPKTALAALPGPEDVPAGLELFAEREELLATGTNAGATPVP